KGELEAYQKEIAPRVTAETKQRDDGIATAEAALKQQAEKLAPKFDEWQKAHAEDSAWVPLKAKELKASVANTKLEQAADLSVFASGANNRGTYTFTAETDLKGITGVRLEVLADDRLPSKGPGRAPNGNFVLTEFELSAAPKAEAAKMQKIALDKAQASFSQE